MNCPDIVSPKLGVDRPLRRALLQDGEDAHNVIEGAPDLHESA